MLEAIANLGAIEAAFKEKLDWFEEVTVRADSFAVEVMFKNQKLVLVLPEGEIVLDWCTLETDKPSFDAINNSNARYIISECLKVLKKPELQELNGKWIFEDYQEFHRNFRMTTY